MTKTDRNSSVSIVTRLRAGRLGFNSRHGNTAPIPGLGHSQPPVQWVRSFFIRGKGDWDVKLTTHLHLVPRLRMPGDLHPLPHTSLWHVS